MKITCDNCGAVYRIPEEKLTKEVSRATCRKCGHKIVIRKPSSSLSGGGFGSRGYGFDDEDESVVNHEERTVIATVPELQRFDSTPPLSVPGGDDEAPVDDEVTSAINRSEATAPANITGSTSSEAVAAAANQAPTSPLSSPLPSGVPIPSANNFDMGPIPLALVGLGIVGTLFLLDGWHWSNTTLTAAGFGTALFAQFAVLMALLDIRKQKSPRLPLVLGVPFAIVVVFFLVLLMLGKDEMAFLAGEDITQIAAVDADSSDLAGTEYVIEEYVDPETGQKKKRKVRRKKAKGKSNIPSVSNGSSNATVASLPDTDLKTPKINALSSGVTDRPRGPSGPGIMDKRYANVGQINESEVRSKISKNDRISQCISRNLKRQKTAGREKYFVEVDPSGKVLDGYFNKKSVLVASEMERCITEQVKKMTFSSFKGKGSVKVAHEFIM